MTRLSLKWRLVAFFVALLIVIECATLIIVDRTAYRSAYARVETDMRQGQQMANQLLLDDAQNLRIAAIAMVRDFAFRESVVVGDHDTVVSVLDNLARRIHASAALFRDLTGRLTSSKPEIEQLLSAKLNDSSVLGEAAMAEEPQVILVGGRAYRLIGVSVHAPNRLGDVFLLFPIDMALAQQFGRLVGAEVSFYAAGPAGYTLLTSTLPGTDAQHISTLLAQAPGLASDLQAELSDGAHVGRTFALGATGGDQVRAVLDRPLQPELVGSHRLRILLIVLASAGTLLSLFASIWIARGVTRPLARLGHAVGLIAAGDYRLPIALETQDEVGAVALGLESMRVGIQEREARISELAYTDSVTGLANSNHYVRALEAHVASAVERSAELSIAVLSVDRFAQINSSLGHATGDAIARAIGERLTSLVDSHEALASCARLGSDEFAVVFPGQNTLQSEQLVKKIYAHLLPPFSYERQAIDVRVTCGVASLSEYATTWQGLLRHAYVALQAAQRAKDMVAVFNPALDDSQREHVSLLGQLQRACEHNELMLHFQPKIELITGRVIGAEALLRWNHPDRGLVAPDAFIPFAEQTGYVTALTHWVIGEAIRQLTEWQRAGIDLQVAINLSVRDLVSQQLPDYVARMVQSSGIAAQLLRFEVTESAYLQDTARAIPVLHALTSAGHRISIDDYGTGYSSLSYLRDLPVDELKIDRSFINGFVKEPALGTIVQSTIQMAHGLGLKVIAEGVETDAERLALIELHCDAMQGYLVARPMAAGVFADWLKSYALTSERARA
jgi:diguanylate cyclase (GGDEF)-like protein